MSVGVHLLRVLKMTETKYIDMAFQLFWHQYDKNPKDFGDWHNAIDSFVENLNIEVTKDNEDDLHKAIVRSLNECRRDLQIVAQCAGVEPDLEQFRDECEREERENLDN